MKHTLFDGGLSWFKVCCCMLLLWISVPSARAQVSVEATIDSLQLLIGEQTKVRLQVSMDANQKLRLPVVADTLVRGVEVLDVAKPDTQLLNDNKRWLISQEYSVPVDTLHPDQFFGPKGVQEVPLTWDDVAPLVYALLLMIILGGVSVFFVIRYRNNKPIIKIIRVEPKLPPHQLAMKKIEEIKADKMARANDPKKYYTELTEVIRMYIRERFGFNAMEMTSAEIIERLLQEDKESVKDLRTLFETADLVKFAKHAPLMNENDMNLVNAVDFINQTKVEEDPNAKKEPTEIRVEEKRSKQGRIVLLASIAVTGLAAVVALYVAVRHIIDLFF